MTEFSWRWPDDWPENVKLAAQDLYLCRFPRSGARIVAIGKLVEALRGQPSEGPAQ